MGWTWLVKHLMMLKCRSGVEVLEVSQWYLVVVAASSKDTPEQKVRLVFDITSLQWVTTTLLDREPLNEGTRVLLEHTQPGGVASPSLGSHRNYNTEEPSPPLTALLHSHLPTWTSSLRQGPIAANLPDRRTNRSGGWRATHAWPEETGLCEPMPGLCGPTEKCSGCSEAQNLPQLLFSQHFWGRDLDWCNPSPGGESCQELLRVWAEVFQPRKVRGEGLFKQFWEGLLLMNYFSRNNANVKVPPLLKVDFIAIFSYAIFLYPLHYIWSKTSFVGLVSYWDLQRQSGTF